MCESDEAGLKYHSHKCSTFKSIDNAYLANSHIKWTQGIHKSATNLDFFPKLSRDRLKLRQIKQASESLSDHLFHSHRKGKQKSNYVLPF